MAYTCYACGSKMIQTEENFFKCYRKKCSYVGWINDDGEMEFDDGTGYDYDEVFDEDDDE